ncbi:MAG: 16S rRNA (adenine(1518)-N(6)/adenine(1519)-N(6))-dimethyltransferase RsmA [Oscillospiraceae bacterium]|nr:16S rRNA (adenine(1518)-N(6)/adenine(1519)-N(6))-dimethyltransferase RsmA [Oscillospiraceae bacterium]
MCFDRRGISELTKRFGLRASKSLGQHFLAAPDITEDIAVLSGADKQSVVVEIGPGLGALTAELSKRAAVVIALEADKRLLPVLEYTLGGFENVEVRHADALKTDLAAIVRDMGLRPKLCANLPYNITTPLLAAILTPGCFESATVMVQREVARRITARPGTEAYGAFTLFVRNRADARVVLEVPPSAFIPPPKVYSAVLSLERVPLRCAHPMFEPAVRAAFAQRRKQLINALPAGLSISRERAVEALEACGIDPTARGETLPLEAFARLAECL